MDGTNHAAGVHGCGSDGGKCPFQRMDVVLLPKKVRRNEDLKHENVGKHGGHVPRIYLEQQRW